MNWCMLIPLLVGAICALFGYWLGKLFGGGNRQNFNVNAYKNRIAKLEADLEDSKSSSSAGLGMASSFAAGVSEKTFNAAAAKAIFGKKIKENDLTIVEGIGPKIQALFHNQSIETWQALSNCTEEKCHEVLNSGGERFKIHKPGTWPKQALLASQGKWKELLEWQEELDGGK